MQFPVRTPKMWCKEFVVALLLLGLVYALKSEWVIGFAGGFSVFFLNSFLFELSAKKSNGMEEYSPQLVLAFFYMATLMRFILAAIIIYLLISAIHLPANAVVFGFIVLQMTHTLRYFKKRKRLTD